jgi:hypothetical protein
MGVNEKLALNAAVLREGKKTLACAQAFNPSKERDISLKEIGDACNRNGIKIVSCQLGCFE